jgi:hypothetical protein
LPSHVARHADVLRFTIEEQVMTYTKTYVPFERKRSSSSGLVAVAVASALAAGMLSTTAQARITKIEITSRTTAFGGYSATTWSRTA